MSLGGGAGGAQEIISISKKNTIADLLDCLCVETTEEAFLADFYGNGGGKRSAIKSRSSEPSGQSGEGDEPEVKRRKRTGVDLAESSSADQERGFCVDAVQPSDDDASSSAGSPPSDSDAIHLIDVHISSFTVLDSADVEEYFGEDVLLMRPPDYWVWDSKVAEPGVDLRCFCLNSERTFYNTNGERPYRRIECHSVAKALLNRDPRVFDDADKSYGVERSFDQALGGVPLADMIRGLRLPDGLSIIIAGGAVVNALTGVVRHESDVDCFLVATGNAEKAFSLNQNSSQAQSYLVVSRFYEMLKSSPKIRVETIQRTEAAITFYCSSREDPFGTDRIAGGSLGEEGVIGRFGEQWRQFDFHKEGYPGFERQHLLANERKKKTLRPEIFAEENLKSSAPHVLKIQLVVGYFPSIYAVLKGFDLPCCQVAYDPKTDRFVASPAGAIALKTRTNFLTGVDAVRRTGRGELTITDVRCFGRLEKYYRRFGFGYAFSMKGGRRWGQQLSGLVSSSRRSVLAPLVSAAAADENDPCQQRLVHSWLTNAISSKSWLDKARPDVRASCGMSVKITRLQGGYDFWRAAVMMLYLYDHVVDFYITDDIHDVLLPPQENYISLSNKYYFFPSSIAGKTRATLTAEEDEDDSPKERGIVVPKSLQAPFEFSQFEEGVHALLTRQGCTTTQHVYDEVMGDEKGISSEDLSTPFFSKKDNGVFPTLEDQIAYLEANWFLRRSHMVFNHGLRGMCGLPALSD